MLNAVVHFSATIRAALQKNAYTGLKYYIRSGEHYHTILIQSNTASVHRDTKAEDPLYGSSRLRCRACVGWLTHVNKYFFDPGQNTLSLTNNIILKINAFVHETSALRAEVTAGKCISLLVKNDAHISMILYYFAPEFCIPLLQNFVLLCIGICNF